MLNWTRHYTNKTEIKDFEYRVARIKCTAHRLPKRLEYLSEICRGAVDRRRQAKKFQQTPAGSKFKDDNKVNSKRMEKYTGRDMKAFGKHDFSTHQVGGKSVESA